jgi:hypothetical protein
MLSEPKALVARLRDWQTVTVDVPAVLDAALGGPLHQIGIDFVAVDRYGIASRWTEAHIERALDGLAERLRRHDGAFVGIEHAPAQGRPLLAGALAGQPVVVDSTLCGRAGDGGLALSLADFPPFLALPGDTSMRLAVSPSLDDKVREWLGSGEGWRPICRVEGVLQGVGAGAAIRVLRLRTRVMAPVGAELARKLLEEAFLAEAQAEIQREQYRDSNLVLAKHRLETARAAQPEGDPERLAREAVADDTVPDFPAKQIAAFENAPFAGPIAFWLGVAALLREAGTAQWTKRDRTQLIERFDVAFGPPWRESASLLRHLMPLRVADVRLDALRERVAGALAIEASPARSVVVDDPPASAPPRRELKL